MASVVAVQDEQPISRTYQYRKVMKPMLERKRRARINRCLDELKELLVGALQAEGESVSRLEKADVLELTVRHLHKLRRLQQINENSASEKFKIGFISCTNEVSKYMTTLSSSTNSSVDLSVSSRLLTHLDHCIHQIEAQNNNNNNGPIVPPGPLSSSSSTSTIIMPNSNPALISPQQLQHHHQMNTSSLSPNSAMSAAGPPSSNVVGSAHQHHQQPHHAHQIMIHRAPLMVNNNNIGENKSPSPAHIQNSSMVNGSQHLQQSLPLPLSLCTKQPKLEPMDCGGLNEEPFDLSNNVWRPW